MTDDDDKREDAEDLWADLGSDELPDLSADFTVSFDEESSAAADALAVPEAPNPEPASVAGDSDIDAWLSEPGDEPRPALSVFQEDELGGGGDEADHAILDRSEVQIGTGHSGVPSPSSLEMTSDPFSGIAGEPAAEPSDDFGFFADSGDEQAAEQLGGTPVADADDYGAYVPDDGGIAFDPADAPTETVEVAAAIVPESTPENSRSAKKSVGPLLGILAGGLLAIPIALGILLAGFGRDPFGIAGFLPASLAFLAPAAPGSLPAVSPVLPVEPAAPATQPEPMEPSVADADAGIQGDTDAAPLRPAADSAPVADASAEGGEPSAVSANEMAADDTPADEVARDDTEVPPMAADEVADVDPVMDTPVIEPDAAPLLAMLEPTAPPAPAVIEPAAPPVSEPLDLTALDQAAAAARAATAEIAALEDLTAPAQRRELTAWYRALATYADSLSRLDREAWETGRDLHDAAESMSAVHREIAAAPAIHPALARLARDWMGYERRVNDGVVVPARFQATRQVGPWWRSEVLVGDTEGRSDRRFVVMTRSEPEAEIDEVVFVTGLAVDDDVIWAADLRTAESEAVESAP